MAARRRMAYARGSLSPQSDISLEVAATTLDRRPTLSSVSVSTASPSHVDAAHLAVARKAHPASGHLGHQRNAAPGAACRVPEVVLQPLLLAGPCPPYRGGGLRPLLYREVGG